MRRRFILILIITTISVSLVVAFSIRSTEPPDETSALISAELESSGSLRDGNITQGMAFTVNITISSFADKELTIPLGLSLEGLENVGWLPPLTEEEVFADGVSDEEIENHKLVYINGIMDFILRLSVEAKSIDGGLFIGDDYLNGIIIEVEEL